MTLFKKQKRSETSIPASFSAWFLKEKYFSCYNLLTKQISMSDCLYFPARDVWKYIYCKYLFPSLWYHRFWRYPFLFYQTVFLLDQRSQDTYLNIFGTKRAFKLKQKWFFIMFKELSLKKNKLVFLEDKNLTLKRPWNKDLVPDKKGILFSFSTKFIVTMITITSLSCHERSVKWCN